MSESMKRKKMEGVSKQKFKRGRKAGSVKVTWHAKLKDILEQNLKEKLKEGKGLRINMFNKA